MSISRPVLAPLVALAVASGAVWAPAIAAPTNAKRPPAVAISFDRISSFTPASADPRLAAAFAGRGFSASDFKFTPAASRARPSQLRVAIRTQAPTRTVPRDVAALTSASPISILTPESYKLGVAVGWKRFAVAGDVAKSKGGDPALGGKESALVGVSYSLRKFTGRVAVGAERGDGTQAPALVRNENVSLDVGAAYNLTHSIALTGGVRYKVDQDRVATLKDQRRDSQAVYVGTAFKF